VELTARVLVAGTASGTALVLEHPLSFWGGVDPVTGEIIDRHHPQSGAFTRARILVLPHGRGSSSSSYVLAECIRAGTGPAGIIMHEPDSIIALGALVAAELYPDRTCPVVVVDDGYSSIGTGTPVAIDDGIVVTG